MLGETLRGSGRALNEVRPILITPGFIPSATGSALIECGNTRVICTAIVEDGVPPFKRGSGEGWLTAEYSMLPGSTDKRKSREYLKRDGRSVEIQRLIGRSLRACVDLARLGERTVYIDCDVIQADGGTRTASITGGFVALCLAVDRLIAEGALVDSPVTRQLAAVSVGIVDDAPMVDLEYSEDSRAQVDMNLVMTRAPESELEYVEVQGTGEGRAMSKSELDALIALGEEGVNSLMEEQFLALGGAAQVIGKKPKLVMASGNFNKIKEMRLLLGDLYDVVSMSEMGISAEVEETGETFEENALIKAEAIMKIAGCAAIADDSGLVVDTLGGRPGVHSARYSGVHGDDEANNDLLLSEMRDKSERRARYVCAMALCAPGRRPIVATGECEGEILGERRGEGGFGYDPLFMSHDLKKTFAEASLDEKNRISHRARAITKLMEMISSNART